MERLQLVACGVLLAGLFGCEADVMSLDDAATATATDAADGI